MVWHALPNGGGGYETFVVPLGFSYGGNPTQDTGIDVDIDSDNNNGINPPDRSTYEDFIEDNPLRSGKIIHVNAGDADLDGIPDFADGFDLDGIAGNDDDSAGPNHFVPVVMEIPNGLNLSAARVTLAYDASDPTGVTRDQAGNWQPAPGHLRLWLKDGDQPRNPNSANSPSTAGDYLAPGVYTPAQLGFNDTTHLITAYAEGIAPSYYRADQRITVELDPTGDGQSQITQDAVRITVIGVEAVEPTSDSTAEVRSSLKDSHPAPYFEDVGIVFLGEPHPSEDGTRLLGSFEISNYSGRN